MADNLGYTEGTGANVATDDIGGVQFQRVKLIQGADGTNDGDVSSAAPMQVTLANTGANTNKLLVTPDTHAVTNAGTFAVQVDGAALTALQLIDDAVFSE